MRKTILVPFDFTNESFFALEHAYEFAHSTNTTIHVIYVVNSDKDVEGWQIELNKVIDKFVLSHEIDVVASVRSGNLFDTIYEYAIETNAYLGIMGTHGMKTVNRAMKIIKRFVKIPFVLVQRPISFGEFDKICVPINDQRNWRSKFLWAVHLEFLFKSKIYVIYPETNNAEKFGSISRNLKFAITIFEENSIDFELVKVPETDFYEHVFDHIYINETDVLISMLDEYKKAIPNLKKPQNIELAKKVPVMCVNPKTDILKVGGFIYN